MGAALGAGFIAATILLFVPRASPWSAFTFFSPVVMGRKLPSTLDLPLGLVWLIHLGLGLLYGLLISRVVAGLGRRRAIATGALLGLVLYVVNLGVVSFCVPEFHGAELSVAFTHIVFGLLCAAAYRGLLRRRAMAPTP